MHYAMNYDKINEIAILPFRIWDSGVREQMVALCVALNREKSNLSPFHIHFNMTSHLERK